MAGCSDPRPCFVEQANLRHLEPLFGLPCKVTLKSDVVCSGNDDTSHEQRGVERQVGEDLEPDDLFRLVNGSPTPSLPSHHRRFKTPRLSAFCTVQVLM